MDGISKLNLTDVFVLGPTKLQNVLKDFLAERDLAGVRPATLTFYHNELKIFINWAISNGVENLGDITSDNLRMYFLGLRERRNTKAIHTNYGAVKTYLLWAWGEYELPGNCPILKVKVATPDNEPKPGIELQDVSALLAACDGPFEKRDRAIVLFLTDTGIRRRELCALSISGIENNGTVSLTADGTKTRTARKAFISRQTQKALRAYLATRENLSMDAPLFATKDGEPFTPSGMRQVLRRLCVAAGLPEVGAHSFRRCFALESLRAGGDLVSVSRLLGHSRVETTKLYLCQTEDDLRAVHERTSPVSRLKTR